MKIFEVVKCARKELTDADTPQLDAEVILSSILEHDRSYLHMNRDMILDCNVEKQYFEAIERRKNGEPIQYITGRQEFMGLDFEVRPGVLIPRPDTEVLVEEVLERIKSIINPVVVDVGCGSGAISISIAKYKSDAVVYALDIMDVPLELTAINAAKNGVSDRVRVIRSNMLESLDKGLNNSVDAIVSNPPYIREDVIETLMREVRNHEPREALSGGMDGLYFYREIAKQAFEFLKPSGLVAYEIGYDQRVEVMDILRNNNFYDIQCKKDLAGNDRVVTGWRS